MKSNKQRRLEIKTRRRKKAEALRVKSLARHYYIPMDSIEANRAELAHNNTYGFLPLFYLDKPFKCKTCGISEIWKATSQKWWYEVAKGHIDSTAVHCQACRTKIKQEKEQQKMHMAEMAKRTPHPHDAFFKKRY